MNIGFKQVEKKFLIRWVLANSIGWIVGVIAAIVLSYGVVNVFYPKETNLILGLCIGAVVGYSQWHIIKKYFEISAWWILASAIGLGIPFIVDVILTELSGGESSLIVSENLGRTIIGVSGGLLSGLLQLNIFKSLSKKGTWWIVISALAWGISLLFSTVLISIFSGVVLGVITGIAILWLVKFPDQGDIDTTEQAK